MMKKIFALLIACMALFVLASCTAQKKAEPGLTVKEGVLRVGMDLQYPPFETFDENNEPSGISVDVAQGLADMLGLELEVVNMDFSTLIPALETGDIDIAIASMSITEEREKKVDFSEPYFYFKIIGLLNKEYAQQNSIGEGTQVDDIWALSQTKFIGLAGQISASIPESKGFVVEQAIDKSSAITEVSQGRADILIMSPEVIVGANNAYPDTTQVFWGAFDVSPIGMAVTEGNSELLAKADEYIATLDEEGGVYDKLREKYNDEISDSFGESATMDIYIYE